MFGRNPSTLFPSKLAFCSAQVYYVLIKHKFEWCSDLLYTFARGSFSIWFPQKQQWHRITRREGINHGDLHRSCSSDASKSPPKPTPLSRAVKESRQTDSFVYLVTTTFACHIKSRRIIPMSSRIIWFSAFAAKTYNEICNIGSVHRFFA